MLLLNLKICVYDYSLYWEYAVTVYLDEIVYLHCHQQREYKYKKVILIRGIKSEELSIVPNSLFNRYYSRETV